MRLIALFLILTSALSARLVTTFYGPIEVEESVLLELIDSPAFQRLKGVHQYGVSFYTSPFHENYTRYDHSLGVFAILRLKGALLEEQIAGLLHDISHTVFSHVGDIFFEGTFNLDAYQDRIHEWFCKRYGVEAILQRNGLLLKNVLPKNPSFRALEQPLPHLCADRIDYNIQGAYLRGDLSRDEVVEAVQALEFREGSWFITDPVVWKKIALFALYMTEQCWSSAENYVSSFYLAQAMQYALEQGILEMNEIYFGTDDAVWNKLIQAADLHLKQLMEKVVGAKDLFEVSNGVPDLVIPIKFRGIDPYVDLGGTWLRLTQVDGELANLFNSVRSRVSSGHFINFKPPFESE